MKQHFFLKHLSGSTVNSWISCPRGFFDRKVRGTDFVISPNMCRGKAVEHCVNLWLAGQRYTGPEMIEKVALENYDMEMEGHRRINNNYIKSDDKIRATVGGMAILAVKTYADEFAGKTVQGQLKVVVELPDVTFADGTPIDLLGYIDYKESNLVRDCKAVGQTQSKLCQDYCISGAVYKLATGLPVQYDLFVANKTPVHRPLRMTDEDYEFGLSYLQAAARRIVEVQNCDDPFKMMELIMTFPNLDNIYDKIEKRDVGQQFGIKVRPSDIEEKY